MTSMQPEGGKRQIGGELVIPVLALGFTLYYISTVIDSPWSAKVNAYMVGSVLIVLVLIFLARAFAALLQGQVTLGISDLLTPYEILAKRLAFMAITLGYLVFIHWLGFTLTTFLFLAGSMLVLGGGRRPILCLISAAVMAIVALGVFVFLFEKRFPKGPIENLMATLT